MILNTYQAAAIREVLLALHNTAAVFGTIYFPDGACVTQRRGTGNLEVYTGFANREVYRTQAEFFAAYNLI